MQNQSVVVPEVHCCVGDVGDAEKAELVNAGYGAGEEATVRVIVVLLVVHDVEEVQGFLGGSVLAQDSGEG